MRITFFNRAKIAGRFSIEELFSIIQQELSKCQDLSIRNFFCDSVGNRFKNIFQAQKSQGDINHITGDVHFLALGLNPKKTILTIHDLGRYEKLSGLSKWLYKLLWFDFPLKKIRYVTTVSYYTRNKLLKYFNISPERIRVIYNPVNPTLTFTPKKFNDSKPSILQIGSGPNKNLEGLIEAVKGLSCRLMIIGNPPEYLKARIYKYGIEHNFFFNLSYEEVKQKYIEADIVFFASLHEGFGIPVIEANAIGRPLITSNVCSLPEAAGKAAVIVDPYNVNEIRSGILEIIRNKQLRDQLIQKGQENVQRFQPDKIASQYLNLYKEVYNDIYP